ncbi:MAG: peptidyl-prolyl cis-trans isomerase [Pseudomonadota bacterium]|jgi:cyclophilin family peptidyl-prolyl cis-trans isomerase
MMQKSWYLFKMIPYFLIIFFGGALWSASLYAQQEAILVKMQTNFGTMTLELDADKAPNTVANFKQYVKDGFFDGTIFHRVIGNFMIQGGGFDQQYHQKSTRATIQNEAKNGLKNVKYSIAMARTSAPHSATAQFFINVADNGFLDYPGQDGWGYAVFGKVIEGTDVVDKIKAVKTGRGGPFPTDVPQEMVIIEKVTLVEPAEPKK